MYNPRAVLICLFSLVACGPSNQQQASPGPDTTTADVGEEVTADAPEEIVELLPLEPSEDYLARKAEYLEVCSSNNGPGGEGGFYSQACRVVTGETEYDEAAIKKAMNKVKFRLDTGDFSAAGALRILYLDDAHGALPEPVRLDLEDALKGFKYWVDEPGNDMMCFWTENHQILYHSSELLVGQRYPDHVFENNGMTGADHVAHATPLILHWLDMRARFGFSEWHSNVYFNEDMPALLNLADFAEDPEIRTRAVMVLDIMGYDMLNNYYKGFFATVHGRTYPEKVVDGLQDSTSTAAWLQLGLVDQWTSKKAFTASFMATSEGYFPAPLLEAIAAATRERHEHRQADSFDVDEGPGIGLTYTDDADVIRWFGLSAMAHPKVIEGTVAFLDKWELWNGFLFGLMPEELLALFKAPTGPDDPAQRAEELDVLSRGIALERMHTYTWRTPHYQLSGAQDYSPGRFGTQTHPWQATLSGEAYVFTSVPGDFEAMGMGTTFGSDWTGGWLPRVTLSENLGVIQYRTHDDPILGEYLDQGYAHAYFPMDAFDEVNRDDEHWAIGRLGDGWVALWCDQPLQASAEPSYELVASTTDTTWVVELGGVEDGTTFEDFTAAILAAEIGVEDGVLIYESPSRGPVEVDWDGPMTVAGDEIDIGPYDRFDNEHCHQLRGDRVVRIEQDGQALVLDFETPQRRLVEAP